MAILALFQTALQQGLCYGLVALGVYISYKILDFADLSVDGTFPLGGAVTAIILTGGGNGFLALLASAACGCVAGMVTGFLHVKFKITGLLSGILVMTALLSINLLITDLKPNISLSGTDTIFSGGFFSTEGGIIVMLIIIAVLIKFLMDAFLKTKSGFLLRAAGDNPQLITSLGKNVGNVKIVGLMIANALVSLGGSVFVQSTQNYANSAGVGTVVIGLFAVIMGCAIFKKVKFVKPTTAVIIGAFLYYVVMNVGLYAGINSTLLKVLMAAIFVVLLIINNGMIQIWFRQAASFFGKQNWVIKIKNSSRRKKKKHPSEEDDNAETH